MTTVTDGVVDDDDYVEAKVREHLDEVKRMGLTYDETDKSLLREIISRYVREGVTMEQMERDVKKVRSAIEKVRKKSKIGAFRIGSFEVLAMSLVEQASTLDEAKVMAETFGEAFVQLTKDFYIYNNPDETAK